MKIKFKSILIEGKIEDLVQKYPKLKSLYDNHELSKLKPSYVQWIAIQNEPPEDVIGLISVFEKNIQRLKEKDIFKYNAGSLREELESLDSSIKDIKTEEATKIGQFGDWLVVMPHTIRASCFYGRGTQWCTAATKSENFFLSYTAREYENILLYYCLNNKIDGPNSKISIGIEDAKLTDDVNMTVDATNKDLDNENLKEIFKDQYENIMQSIINHYIQIKGQHPAKIQLQELMKNSDKCINYLSKLDKNQQKDFSLSILKYRNVNPQILDYIAKNIKSLRIYVAKHRNTSLQTLNILAQDENTHVIDKVAKNRNASTELLNFIFKTNMENFYIRFSLSGNPNTSTEVLDFLAKDEFSSQRERVADHPNASLETLNLLAQDKHPTVKTFALRQLNSRKNSSIKESFNIKFKR